MLLARLRSLLFGLLRRGRLEAELDSELRFHLEARADALEREGLPREEALRRARLELGSLETHKEDYRAARGLRFFDELRQDLLYALRSFRRNPGFTAVALLTLALGIGANTAMFSLVRGVLLRSLPYRDAERIVTANVSLPDFEDLRQASALDGAAVWGSNLYLLGGDGPAEQVRGATVSADFFPLLGSAAIGRALGPGDGREKVVVLGHGLWTRRFAADPRVLGTSVRLSADLYTIVGVMPAEFQYPSSQFEVWVPMGPALDVAPQQAKNRSLRIFRALLRLAPGVSLRQAQAEADAIAQRLEAEHRDTNEGIRLTLVPLYERLVGGVRRALLVLMGVVALVLLIAAANVANLLLARAKTREREIAVRTALGAGRGRIVRQLLTESLFLACGGSALGVVLAYWLLQLLPALAVSQVPRLSSVRVDVGVLGFTAAVAIATGLLFGLAPAWQASRLDDGMRGLREAGRGSAGGSVARRVRASLTAAEVALALVVLIGAGLLGQSLVRLLRVDAGFVADRLLTFNVQYVAPCTPEKRAQLAAEVVARVAKFPGVVAAGGGTALPPMTAQRGTGFVAEGARDGSVAARRAYFIGVLPGYFRALGTRLVEGRDVKDTDAAGAPEVILVNRSLARRLYGSESALGRRIRLVNPEYAGSWRTVVGVVDDVRYSGLDDPGEAALYTPFAQTPFLWSYVMVRSAGPPMALAASLRDAVRSVDPGLEAAAVKPMSDVVAETVVQPRFNVLLLSAFALLALVLAAVGIYGVVAYSVVQRTREIGVRVALGATRGDVLRLVTGEGLRMAGLGVVLGLFGAAAASRLLTALLFEVRPGDPATFALAALFLVLVAAAASAVPAWRATRLAPVVALHTE
jgi:predicted permease